MASCKYTNINDVDKVLRKALAESGGFPEKIKKIYQETDKALTLEFKQLVETMRLALQTFGSEEFKRSMDEVGDLDTLLELSDKATVTPSENPDPEESQESHEVAKRLSEQTISKFFQQDDKVADFAQLYFKRSTKVQLVNNLLVDKTHRALVNDDFTLNINIRLLKQHLIDTINAYLGPKGMPFQLFNIFTDTTNIRKYDEFIDKVSKEFPTNVTTLEKAYKDFKFANPNWQESKKYLDAYNAFVFLTNFDTVLQFALGDTIIINPTYFNQQVCNNTQYAFSKSSALGDAQVFDQEITDIATQVSALPKLLIETTRRYNYGGDVPIEDAYISFNDFNRIIGKIKALAVQKVNSDVLAPGRAAETSIESLNATTQAVINELKNQGITYPTLFDIANNMGNNPSRYLQAIFDILATQKAILTVPDLGFDSYDKDIIWSLYKDLFSIPSRESIAGTDVEPSLAYLHSLNRQDSLYPAVCAIANSIYSEDFAQHYLNFEGNLASRRLSDFAVEGSVRQLLASYKAKASRNLPENIKNISTLNHIIGSLNGKNVSVLNELILDIKGDPDQNIKYSLQIQVTNGEANIVWLDQNSLPIRNSKFSDADQLELQKLWNSNQFQALVKSALDKDFAADPELFRSYVIAVQATTAEKGIESINYGTLFNNISQLIGRIIFNGTVNAEIIPEMLRRANEGVDPNAALQYSIDLISSLREALAVQYPDDSLRPKLNQGTGLIDPIGIKDYRLIEGLGKAICIARGTLGKASYKTAEETQIAAQSLSRLRNAYGWQLSRFNRRETSATNHTTFVQDPNGFFMGVITNREYKNEDGARPIHKISTGEYIQLNFMDFVAGLTTSKNSYDLFKNGIVGFTPTVNSDKSQLDLLLVDLKAKSKHTGKQYLYYSADDIVAEIVTEIGQAYQKSLQGIQRDLSNVAQQAMGLTIPKTYSAQQVLSAIQESILTTPKYQELFAAINPETGKPYTPKDIIKKGIHDALLQYNRNTVTPLALAEDIHYNFDSKDNLIVNPELLNLTKVLTDTTSASDFFKLKELELAEDLLESNFEVILEGPLVNRTQKELEFLRGTYRTEDTNSPYQKLSEENIGWISDTGKLLIARIQRTKGDGSIEYIPIKTVEELKQAQANGELIEVHPILVKMNRFDFLTSQQYTLATVGSHVFHKTKSKSANTTVRESDRWLASTKRNNALTATVSKFDLGLINGIPSKYNIAIIDDISAPVYNMMGLMDFHHPLDGGMFVNGFINYLENNSLGPNKAGVDKKQFGTFYNPDVMAGGQIKTAGFAATNDRMRMSEVWERLQRKMSDRIWKDQNGNQVSIDITEDTLSGESIAWEHKNIYYKRIDPEDGKYYNYQLVSLTYKGDDSYEIQEQKVNNDGTATSGIKFRNISNINTNWKVYNEIFGGKYSLELGPNGQLRWSENSMKFMVEAINRCGVWTNEEARDLYRDPKKNYVPSQSDFYQPLKYSDIHYAPNKGAIKSLIYNVNPSTALYNDSEFNYFTMEVQQLGIQLDKEHHVDESEVSMPSQIISACGNKGYTLNDANSLYKALAALSKIVTDRYYEGVEQLVSELTENGQVKEDAQAMHTLQLEMAKTLAEELMVNAEDNEDLADLLADLIIAMEKGEELTPELIVGKLPWSDGMIFGKVYAKAASILTKKGIKLKFAGSLAVINPTTGVIRLHGNRKFDSYMKASDEGVVSAEQKLAEEQQQIANGNIPDKMIFDVDWEFGNETTESKLNALAKRVELQHNYIIQYTDGSTEKVSLNTPEDYYKLQEKIRQGKTIHLSNIAANLKLLGTGTKNVSDLGRLISRDLDGNLTINDQAFEDFITATSEYFTQLPDGRFKPNKRFDLTNRPEKHGIEGEAFTKDHLKNVLDTVVKVNTIDPDMQLSDEDLEAVALAAIFHDLGKPFKNNDHGLDSLTILNELFDDSVTPDVKLAVRFHMLSATSPQYLYDLMVKEVANANIDHRKFKTLIKALKICDIVAGRDLTAPDTVFEGKTLGDAVKLSMDSFDARYDGAMNRVANLGLANPDSNLNFNDVLDVVKIYEDVETPRDLAAYNVKFRTTNKEGRNNFNIFDLDSVKVLYKLEGKNFKWNDFWQGIKWNSYKAGNFKDLDSGTLYLISFVEELARQTLVDPVDIQNFIQNFKDFEALKIRIRNEMQLDMHKLSEDFPDVVVDTIEGKTVTAPGRLVSIGNQKYEVDASSIDIIPFELIMPKAFASQFGLFQHDDLQEILADKMWFGKRNFKNLKSKLASHPAYYSYELKRFNGDHVYIITDEQFRALEQAEGEAFSRNLRRSGNFFTKSNADGSTDRVNLQGEVIHELASDKDVVYNVFQGEDYKGIEVIRTNNPEFYINNLDYNLLSVSDSITDKTDYAEHMTELIERIRNSKSRKIQTFFDIHAESKTADNFAKAEQTLEKTIAVEEELNTKGQSIFTSNFNINAAYKKKHNEKVPNNLITLLDHIKSNAKEMHSSFDESLNVLAGRIPAQSQQSFMTQRVVAFDNPDINSAYVGVFQLWLQGSDLDIDAVTLLGSEFTQDGKYVMWSPYARVDSIAKLNASKKLPFPNGEIIRPEEIKRGISFIKQYADYFTNGTIQLKFNKPKNTYELKFNTSSASSIESLGRLLRDIEIYKIKYPSNILEKEVIDIKVGDSIQSVGIAQFLANWTASQKNNKKLSETTTKDSTTEDLTTAPITFEIITDLASQLSEFVNRHNQYQLSASARKRAQMTKNFAVKSMWNVIVSPANITQAMVSVDTATSLLKSEAAKSAKAKSGERTNPGNMVSKYKQIQEGSVGKDCVGITAVGTKANSILQFYQNYILNNQRGDHKILVPDVQIAGKTYKCFANLHDKTRLQRLDGKSQLSDDVLANIIDTLNDKWEMDYDSAVTIAAFLSISVDNAKDLALAKLNAGPEMVGMYVFGAALGVPAETLIQIINSPLGELLSSLTKGNTLAKAPKMSRVLQAIDYLEKGFAYQYVTKFDTPYTEIQIRDRENKFIPVTLSIDSKTNKPITQQSQVLVDDILKCFEKSAVAEDEDFKRAKKNLAVLLNVVAKHGEIQTLLEYTKTPKSTTHKMLSNCKKYAKESTENINPCNTWYYGMQQLLEYVQSYDSLQQTWNNPSTSQIKQDLVTLAKGGEEFRILGAILSANKGVKGKIEDGNNWISNIEQAIIKAGNVDALQPDEVQKINITRFVTDKAYQKQMIDIYDKCKVAVNILQVITTVPHIYEYVKTCVIPYAFLLDSSKRFRTIQKYCNEEMYETLGAYSTLDKTTVYQGVNNAFAQESLINWLSLKNTTITVPEGFVKFQDRGILKPVTNEGGEVIRLGSEVGLANFKKYMEEIVFPAIREGKYANSGDNTFIRDLTTFNLSKTAGHQTTEAYTLVGSLLPNTEEEKITYNQYVADFFTLGNEAMQGRSKESDIKTLEEAIYIYASYVNGGRLGPQSLLGLFKNHPSTTQESFREYLAKEDVDGEFNWSLEKIQKYCNPIGSAISSTSSGVYASDNKHIGYTHMLRNDMDGEELAIYIEKEGRMPDPYIPSETSLDKLRELLPGETKSTLQERFKYFLYPDVITPKTGESTYKLTYTLDKTGASPQTVQLELDATTDDVKNIKILKGTRQDKKATDLVTKAINSETGKETWSKIMRRPVFREDKLIVTKDPYALINFIKEQLKNCD